LGGGFAVGSTSREDVRHKLSTILEVGPKSPSDGVGCSDELPSPRGGHGVHALFLGEGMVFTPVISVEIRMNHNKRVSISSTKQKGKDLANECVDIDPSTKYLLNVPAPPDEDDPRRIPRAVAPEVALGIVDQITAWSDRECPFKRGGEEAMQKV
jgi:hypothetical protein